MKKIFAVVLVGAVLLSLFACGSVSSGLEALELVGEYSRDFEGTQLNVYNWGEYISDGAEGSLNVVLAFEELTGIDVNYDNFDTNEFLYRKIATGMAGFDVIIPSDYIIQRMIDEELLQPLNFDNIPNASYIMEEYQNLYFDPDGLYSVPYTIGMVGLIYNSALVEEAPTSWSALWDPRYEGQLLQFNSMRDAFGIAQFLLGQNINSADEADWRAAANKLKEQAPLVRSYISDEVYTIMGGSNAALAPYYAGDFLMMQDSNPDLEFVYPEEGTNFFYDSICIPKDAHNVEAAEMFINFLMEPDVALANAEYIMYASPHRAVRENPDYSLRGNEFLYPAQPPKVQSFENLPKNILTLMNNLWSEVMQA